MLPQKSSKIWLIRRASTNLELDPDPIATTVVVGLGCPRVFVPQQILGVDVALFGVEPL